MASHGPAGALPAAALDVKPDWQVLDTGWGRGTHTLGLARRFGLLCAYGYTIVVWSGSMR